MKDTSLSTFIQDIQHDKVIVFFHKHGCSNCSKTKPLLEQLEKENPDVKVISYLCVEPDDITKHLPIRVFPGIFCYSKGKMIAGDGKHYPVDFYLSAFLDTRDKKSSMYDLSQAIANMEVQMNEMKSRADFINHSIVLEATEWQIIPADDFELWDPNSKKPEECDSCQ